MNVQDTTLTLLIPRQRFRRLASFAAIGWILGAFLCGKTATASGNLAQALYGLRADNIVLMPVPSGTSFRGKMDEAGLPTASCVYEVRPGPSFDDVIETLGSLVTQYNSRKPDLWHAPDLRVGIVFERNRTVLRKFYFDDFGGAHDVRGFSGDRELTAKADLPERLRATAVQQNVTLVGAGHFPCA